MFLTRGTRWFVTPLAKAQLETVLKEERHFRKVLQVFGRTSWLSQPIGSTRLVNSDLLLSSIACLSVLEEGSLHCGSSWGFFRCCFFYQHVKFFLARIEGLRTEDVVHCTDCKAHWGKVIVILDYINKIDLIWFKRALPPVEQMFYLNLNIQQTLYSFGTNDRVRFLRSLRCCFPNELPLHSLVGTHKPRLQLPVVHKTLIGSKACSWPQSA